MAAKDLIAYQVKPGEARNPTGRPKIPEDIKEARQITQFEFERIANRFLFLQAPELDEAMKPSARGELTVLEALVGGIIQDAVRKKDAKKAEWILTRTLGKVRERLEVSAAPGTGGTTNVQVNLGLGLDDPNLTMAQLKELEAKLERISVEGVEGTKFAVKVHATPGEEIERAGGGADPQAATLEAEVVE